MIPSRAALALAAAALALPLMAAQAEAECWQRVTNRSGDVWTVGMPNQGYPYAVDHTLHPGDSVRFQIDPSARENHLRLTRGETWVEYDVDACQVRLADGCANASSSRRGQQYQEIELNDPARGEIILRDTPPTAERNADGGGFARLLLEASECTSR